MQARVNREMWRSGVADSFNKGLEAVNEEVK